MLQKTDVAGIYKDETTGALINKDKQKLSAYKMQKKKMQQVNDAITQVQIVQQQNKQLVERVERLENLVAELSTKEE